MESSLPGLHPIFASSQDDHVQNMVAVGIELGLIRLRRQKKSMAILFRKMGA